ncbi:SHOCT domain-containing protein [Amycolatopsis sp. NPDC049253]|jgi:putative membrane protein|uniref:SHOCT domain-containing protein n=1 Tax=Amycolatopsis sp. NPDC049253 TaxID=3155274 RepID=UPI00342163C0
MYWDGYGMSGWGLALMTIGNLVLWALVIVAIIALVRVLSRRSGPGDGERSTPEQVLAERFARGEIDEQTYRRDLETLRQLRHSTSGGS